MSQAIFQKPVRMYKETYLSACKWLVTNRTTLQRTSDEFGIAKSTLFRFIQQHLQNEDEKLYKRVRRRLEKNKQDSRFPKGSTFRKMLRNVKKT